MIDGKYSIVMQTPMGPVNGTLLLKTEGETLSGVEKHCNLPSGVLEAMGGRHPFSGGTVQGEDCAFSSVFQTPLGRLQLSVKGSVHGDVFRATARTQMGVINAMGKRTHSSGQRNP